MTAGGLDHKHEGLIELWQETQVPSATNSNNFEVPFRESQRSTSHQVSEEESFEYSSEDSESEATGESFEYISEVSDLGSYGFSEMSRHEPSTIDEERSSELSQNSPITHGYIKGNGLPRGSSMSGGSTKGISHESLTSIQWVGLVACGVAIGLVLFLPKFARFRRCIAAAGGPAAVSASESTSPPGLGDEKSDRDGIDGGCGGSTGPTMEMQNFSPP